MDAQKMLSNGWNSMRDAGEAALNYPLVKQLPKVKEWAATGAGLAVAKRGGKIAVGAVRRHPLLAVAGAVALAGLGLAVMAKRRREAAANASEDGSARPRRVKATNMRGNTGAKRASRSRTRASSTE
jgi:hypothetical protein